MLKYVDTKVVMAEVPDEISLAINISGCPCNCKGCHSPYLAEDIGEPLTVAVLSRLVAKNEGITCVCFMGGDADPFEVNVLAMAVKANTNLKTAWYSGRDDIEEYLFTNFDYVKFGSYKEDKGPLNNPSTNQRMYKICRSQTHLTVLDITNRFWKDEDKS